MVIREADAMAIICDFVDIRSLNFRSKTAAIAESKVIGNNDQKIGAFSSHRDAAPADEVYPGTASCKYISFTMIASLTKEA